jgi:hypothetical protein
VFFALFLVMLVMLFFVIHRCSFDSADGPATSCDDTIRGGNPCLVGRDAQ